MYIHRDCVRIAVLCSDSKGLWGGMVYSKVSEALHRELRYINIQKYKDECLTHAHM